MQFKKFSDQCGPLRAFGIVLPAFDGLAALQVAQFPESRVEPVGVADEIVVVTQQEFNACFESRFNVDA